MGALVAIAGCQGSPPAQSVANPAQQALSAKLKAMPADQRAKYLREHPQELGAALPGFGPPTHTPKSP